MKRIMIIIGNHSPEPSSVSNCFSPLIKKLMESGFIIDIITDRKRTDIQEYEYNSSIGIYRIDDYRTMNSCAVNELTKIDSTGFLKFITKITAFILKVCYYITYCLFSKESGTAGWDMKKAVDKCIELYDKNHYDAVISVSLPFRAHYITKRFLNKIENKLTWIMYEYDPFYYNKEIQISPFKKKSILRDEYSMFKSCDKIFLTPELYNFYKKTLFNELSDKFISLPYANLSQLIYNTEEISTDIKLSNEHINCLFTGRLYSDIRNPDYTIKLFSQLSKDIQLTLLTNYSKEQMIEDDSKSENRLIVFPFQKRNVVIDLYMQADILVNIGNTVEFQVPGKIFEYMSTGKPIIHISKIPDDPAILYFEKYPYFLAINEWEGNIKEQAVKIEEFCRKYRGCHLEYAKVCKALNGLDEQSVTNQFVDALMKLFEEKSNEQLIAQGER